MVSTNMVLFVVSSILCVWYFGGGMAQCPGSVGLIQRVLGADGHVHLLLQLGTLLTVGLFGPVRLGDPN